MAIDSKNLLVAVKSYARAEALPLDASEVYDSLAAAQEYAKAANAYAGQTIKALVNGEYKTYTIQPSKAGYVLKESGLTHADITQYVQIYYDETLPETGEEGIIYLQDPSGQGRAVDGYTWHSGKYFKVMTDIETITTDINDLKTNSATKTECSHLQNDINSIDAKIDTLITKDDAESKIATAKSEAIASAEEKDTALKTELNKEIAKKAPIANPVFTGSVTLPVDPTENLHAATKQYVDRLISNLVSTVPGIVDAEHPLPASHKAGQTWRAAADGVYAEHKCETGDLIICLLDGETVVGTDFMVVQANIDGAVTSSVTTSTVGNIVVFDSITGRVIKDSKVSIASLETALKDIATLKTSVAAVDGKIATAKTEAIDAAAASVDEKLVTVNASIKEAKDEADQNKADIAAANKAAVALTDRVSALDAESTGRVAKAEAAIKANETAIADLGTKKADKATTLEGYGITDAYTKESVDATVKTINDNLDSKISTKDAETKIAAAKTEAVTEATTQSKTTLNDRLGDAIGEDTTVAAYIAKQVEGIGTEAGIAAAKEAAIKASKEYTDQQIAASVLNVVEF